MKMNNDSCTNDIVREGEGGEQEEAKHVSRVQWGQGGILSGSTAAPLTEIFRN